MPLVLKNEGELVCKAVIDIEDPKGVFSIEPDESVRILAPEITFDLGKVQVPQHLRRETQKWFWNLEQHHRLTNKC